MRILYLTNGFPFPLTSGYLRHYHLIRELSQRHRITLVSLVNSKFKAEHAEAMAPFTERVVPIPAYGKPNSLANKAIRQLHQLTGAAPSIHKMCATVKELANEGRFDLALFCGRETLPAIEMLKPTPVIADLCDAASVRIRGRMPYASWSRRCWLQLEYLRMQRIERSLVQSVAHTLFASCRDRDAVLPATDCTTVIPNGVDIDYWHRSAAESDESNTIVFTGAMNYRPNTDAALYLIEEILPLVRKNHLEVKLLIVGRDPTAKLLKAGERPGVTVTGFVDDVRPYLERAAVFAAPLRFGAGIQNKLLEAMAMEVPVVASKLAADGLQTEMGETPPIAVADGRNQFATLISNQLAKQGGKPVRAPQSREYVKEHFVWKRSGEKLEQALNQTLCINEL